MTKSQLLLSIWLLPIIPMALHFIVEARQRLERWKHLQSTQVYTRPPEYTCGDLVRWLFWTLTPVLNAAMLVGVLGVYSEALMERLNKKRLPFQRKHP